MYSYFSKSNKFDFFSQVSKHQLWNGADIACTLHLMLDPNEEKRINQKNWRMMQKEKKFECIAIKTNLFPPLSDEIEQFCENEHWALSPLIKKCNFKNQKSSKKPKKKQQTEY